MHILGEYLKVRQFLEEIKIYVYYGKKVNCVETYFNQKHSDVANRN